MTNFFDLDEHPVSIKFAGFDKEHWFVARYDHDEKHWRIGDEPGEPLGLPAFLEMWGEGPGDRAYTMGDGSPVLAAHLNGEVSVGVWRLHHDDGFALSDFPFIGDAGFTVVTEPPAKPGPPPIADPPKPLRFMEFGERVATLLASTERWDGDVFQDIAGIAIDHLGVDLGSDAEPEVLRMWQQRAARFGYEYEIEIPDE